MGAYWLNSNLWGAQTGVGSQCLWDTSLDGATIAWGTSWDWTGAADTVRSYNCAVLGWHWGWKHAHTGLPLRLDTRPRIQTSWGFTLAQTRPGGLNVSYDLWLSRDPQLGNANASEEVMLWLSRSGDIRPHRAWDAQGNLSLERGGGVEVFTGAGRVDTTAYSVGIGEASRAR